MVWDPRIPEALHGTTDDSFTLNVDLAPTILGAANLTPPEVMQGRDISDLYLKDEANWRQDFFYEYPSIFGKRKIPGSTAVVQKGIKYIEWPQWGMQQLFNLTNDPMEEQDEIKNPAYQEILSELKIRHEELKQSVL